VDLDSIGRRHHEDNCAGRRYSEGTDFRTIVPRKWENQVTVASGSGTKNRPNQGPDDVWADRLGKVADSIDGHNDALEDELELRDQLIIKASEAGWPRAQVARWARVSPTRVHQVLARPPAA
jgi:hypothetical protein